MDEGESSMDKKHAFRKNISFYLSVVFNVIEGMLAGFNFIVLYYTIKALITEQLTMSMLTQTILLLGAVFVIRLIVYAFGYTRGQIGGAQVSRILRLSLGDKMKKIPLSSFTKAQIGEYINATTTSVNNYENILTHKIGDIIKNTSFSLLLIGFVATHSISAGIVLLCSGLLLLPSLHLSFLMVKKYGNEKKNIMTKNTSDVVEYINGIQTLRSFGLGGVKNKATTDSMKAYSDISYVYEIKVIPIGTIFSILCWFSLPIVLYLAGHQWLAGNLEASSFFLISISPLFTCKLFGTLFIDLTSYKNFMIAKRQIEAVLDAEEEPSSDAFFEPEQYSIAFHNVNFAYSQEEPVLRDINFEIGSSQFVAIVGPSGSGKSTILNLITKYYEPNRGDILIGQQTIQSIATEKVMQKISMVDQDTFLFNDTILNNIRYTKPEATKQEIINAAKEANCHDFIEKLEYGYDTIIGENGNKLSGGERQRISIARAILKDSPILLLDEATASLDIENELAVKEAIKNLLKKKKTVVMIAHTLSIIKNADNILVVDGGQIVEEGSHQSLIAEEGKYAAMWKKEHQLSIV